MPKRPVLDFMFFDAGGGHRAAATALKQVIENQQRPWDVRLIDVQDVLDELDIFRKLTGLRLEDIYNVLLEKGWTLGSAQLVPLMHGVIRIYHGSQVRVLAREWKASPPDLVVSLVPNFNRSMFEGLRKVSSTIPYVTILTDIADYPPHFWIEKQDQYFICGSPKAEQQALAVGHSRDKVIRASGMILNPRFYEPVNVDVAEGRRKLGLDPSKPTALVMFGGMGSNVMKTIADRLDQSDLDLQCIFICGKNAKLADTLRGRSGRVTKFVEGFTKEIPMYMKLSDWLIGKPGPGSISEAVAMGLPVITERNAWTLPQERYNADWIVENQIGEVVSGFDQIVDASRRMLQPGTLAKYKANAAALHNRAVFEIPDILEKLLKCDPS